MTRLYRCRACGFLSTLGGEFTRRERVLFDTDCLAKADAKQEPVASWVAEAIVADKETRIKGGENAEA